LQRLQAEKGRAAPPTVYRALSFLQELGLVHRIESLNAYVGCDQPEDAHRAHFLICHRCGDAAEIHDGALARAVSGVGRRAGFRIDRETVELQGLCPHCRD
jgi:Fur family zinc uptake transcriptional regulator